MLRRVMCTVLSAALLLFGLAAAEEANRSTSIGEAAAVEDDLAASANDSAPVVVWNRPIFAFRVSYKGIPPAERARRASARIEALPARSDWEVITIFPGDLDPDSHETLETAARAAAGRLKQVLDEHASQMKWPLLSRNIGLAALATVIFALIIWGLLWLRNMIVAKLERVIARLKLPLVIAGINLSPILLLLGSSCTLCAPAPYPTSQFCPWAGCLPCRAAALAKLTDGMRWCAATPGRHYSPVPSI